MIDPATATGLADTASISNSSSSTPTLRTGDFALSRPIVSSSLERPPPLSLLMMRGYE
jgi:hypothetical protein